MAQPRVKKNSVAASTGFSLTNGWVIAGLVILTLALYWPVRQFELTNWDDQVYVTENAMIRGLTAQNIRSIFTEYLMGNYHPLVLLSYALEYEWANGIDPGLMHLTNVVLHLGTGILLFLCWMQLGFSRPVSGLVSLVFLIHPFHVESVAWVTERKDVLYGIFWAGAWYAWLRSRKWDAWRGAAVGLFILSSLSKGMAVTLPAALILGDWIRSSDFRKLPWKDYLPFILLSVGFGILAVYAQKSGGNVREDNAYGWLDQIRVAGWGIWFYLSRTLIPFDLSLFYEYPNLKKESLPMSFSLATLGVLAGIPAFIALLVKKHPIPVAGLVLFLAILFPVSQVFPVGNAIAADRYHYIPSVGLCILLAYGLKRTETNRIIWAGAAIWCIGLMVMARERINMWQNAESLWNATIEDHPQIMFAYKNLAKYLEKKGKVAEAEAVYRRALAQDSSYAVGWNELGVLLKNRGENDAAYPLFVRSVELDSVNKEAWLNIGTWHDRRGEVDAARRAYSRSLALDSGYAEVWNNFGNSYSRTGAHDTAEWYFSKAIQIFPGYAEAHNNRGTNFAMQGKMDSARISFLKSLEIQPGYGEPAYNLGHVYFQLNQKAEGVEWMRKAAASGHPGAKRLLQSNGLE